jgi:RHS repeat-associated protein
MSVFGEIWDGIKQHTGALVNDGAHVIGDGLSAVGLHGAAQWVDTEGDKIGYSLGADVGELQLGQTSDPKELVHGDAGKIRAAAAKLRTFQTGLGEVADGLNRIDTGQWEGQAADAFRAKFAPEPPKWSAAATAMGKAAAALESYSSAVESAQSEAQRAIELWNQGQQATRQAVAAYNQQVSAYNNAAQAYDARLQAGQDPGARPSEPGKFTDPGAALRDQAQQVLSAARQARNAAAASATAAVRSGTSMAPAEPEFWSQLGDDLSDGFSVANLADISITSGILLGAADIVKFGRALNPDDQWNKEHPAEYFAGASAMLAGIVDMQFNPRAAAEGLVGTGWGSDPFQAFGKLVPNIALTVLTDGGGAAADASDLSRLGELSSDDPALSMAGRDADGIPGAGDPVDVATGDVILRQTDVSLPGALPLVLRRVHRSSQRGGRWFGESWVSSLDQRLLVMPDRLVAVFGDGQVLVYRRPELDGVGSEGLPVTGPCWPLTRVGEDAYTVTDRQGGLTWRFEAHSAYWRYAGGQGEFPLTSVRDRSGHEISFAYGEAGEPVSVTHSGGYRVDVTVAGGRVAELSLRGTSLTRYAYNESGQLTGIVNSSGQPLRLSYDDSGRVGGYTERNGLSYRYTYDNLGRCVRGESPSGALSGTFEYRDGATWWTDATGAVTVYALDRSARIAAVTDPVGGVIRYAYDARGRKTSQTDPLGRVTSYAHDTTGNLVSVTRPDGAVARASYDDRCQPVVLEEPGRGIWRQDFDDLGNRIALTRPDGAVVRYAYDGAGHLAAVTGPDSAVTSVACDASGLPVAMTRSDGALTQYERDAFGRVVRILDPAGAVTALTWSIEGRPLSRAFPDGSSESWNRDADGNVLEHVSPGGAVSSYEHGPFDKVTAMTGPDGTRTSFGYDLELRLASVIHGGLTWSYAHDAAGRVVAETDYNGAVTRYVLDAAGQVTRRVNAVGQELKYAYDALGNVVSESAGDSVTTFGYDEAGGLILARNADAEVTWTRDALGRITAESCDGRVISMSYDAAGRMTGRATPSGAVSSWAYDSAGLPVSLSAAGQTLRFGHGITGAETSRELPGGVTLAQDWDALGRLTGQVLAGPDLGSGGTAGGAPAVLQQRQYAYSPDGYITGVSDLMTGARAFGLDAAGRVTTVTGAEWIEHYTYDPAGNLTSATWPAVSPELAGGWLDATPQGARSVSGTLTRQAGGIRYRHDAAGRVVQRTRKRLSRKPETWRYEWDADNRLTSVITPDGSTWRYAYDPLGRRVRKQQAAPDGTVLTETRFTWDGLVLAEQAELIPGGTSRESVTTWDYRPGTFMPLTQTTRTALKDAPQEVIDGEFYAIITNLTGTPSELVASDGALAGFQQHTLWGGTIWHPEGASTPLRFPGQYADDETGLHYNNQRYYDPANGTYLSPDPLGLAPAPNPHAYVDNPQVLIDPLGLAADDSYAPQAASAGSSIPESTIIARGGTTDLLPPGQVFSGSQGQTVAEAGQGVVHGQFRWATASDIRAAGGTVEPAPELNPAIGKMNYQHVDVCLGAGACPWSDLVPNVAKNFRFGGMDYPFYDGYLRWGP